MSKQDWDRAHRRYQLVNELAERPELLAEPLPPEVAAEFGTREQALQAVHQRWVTLLRGCLDVEMETGAYGNGPKALAHAARRAITHAPALHRTITALREDPLVADLEQRLHTGLAYAIGVNRPGGSLGSALQEVRGVLDQAAALGHLPQQRWRPRHPFKWTRRPEAMELV